MRTPLSGALGSRWKGSWAHGPVLVSGGLRYYMHDAASSFRFKLAGSLVGDDVAELGQCWSTASSALGSRPFLVDIDELCEAKDYGRDLLAQGQQQAPHLLS